MDFGSRVSISSKRRREYLIYRILPNKGAGCCSKVTSGGLDTMLRFEASQRWLRIENRTIINKTVSILLSYNKTGSLQIIGGALIRGGALNGQITVGGNAMMALLSYCRVPEGRGVHKTTKPPNRDKTRSVTD